MKSFKEFGIKATSQTLVGDKIKIERVLNRLITVHDFRVVESKYDKGNGKCLHLQVELDDTKRVIFTGSSVLIDLIQQVPKGEFPFQTTIVKDDGRYEFT